MSLSKYQENFEDIFMGTGQYINGKSQHIPC